MSDRTDPAWDEYLSTGEDPTGGELEDADEERNHERIRHNREKKNWELENPKKAAAIAIIKGLLTISTIVLFICLALKECS